MATYKVIQDIEAEDKLIGPFGIRQFVYLIIVAVSLFVGFRLFIVAWFLVLPLLPHTIFFSLLALPFGGEQPTETWLLAKIRFALKPRKRIWNQSGTRDLVTITAPKKIEKILTKNMSEGEVRSRLEALANTIDSRGWAIKNVNAALFSTPTLAAAGAGSDRLIDISSMSAAAPDDTTATDDILDEQNNPTAQSLDRMISASSKAHRDQIVSNMKNPQPLSVQLPTPVPGQPQASQPPAQPDYWFLNSNGPAMQPPGPGSLPAAPGSTIVTPDPAAIQQSQGMPLKPLAPAGGPLTEEELLEKIHAEQKTPKNYGNMRVIKTLEEQQAEAKAAASAAAAMPVQPALPPAYDQPVTQAPDPDIIGLATNDDLDVATIARQANKKPKEQGLSDGEVVINLH
ncbi:MAG TPA: PrgI family protein [Candidatus Limnocylindria bacterium]|nr:PrgI family protein [Candidatus Limnocylindria bacterium]